MTGNKGWVEILGVNSKPRCPSRSLRKLKLNFLLLSKVIFFICKHDSVDLNNVLLMEEKVDKQHGRQYLTPGVLLFNSHLFGGSWLTQLSVASLPPAVTSHFQLGCVKSCWPARSHSGCGLPHHSFLPVLKLQASVGANICFSSSSARLHATSQITLVPVHSENPSPHSCLSLWRRLLNGFCPGLLFKENF